VRAINDAPKESRFDGRSSHAVFSSAGASPPQIVLQLFANIERAMNAAFSTGSSGRWHDGTIQRDE
jgi:hypothetical protein